MGPSLPFFGFIFHIIEVTKEGFYGFIRYTGMPIVLSSLAMLGGRKGFQRQE